jgi:hypothetical protein
MSDIDPATGTAGFGPSAQLPLRRGTTLRLYMAAIVVAAAALILATLPGLPRQEWAQLVIFGLVAALAELWAAPTSVRGDVCLSFAVNFAATVLFGPCFGALSACIGSLLGDRITHRKGAMKTAFNAAQVALSCGMAGLAFEALKVGPRLSLTSDALAFAAAAGTYVLANSALASGAIALCGRPFIHQWLFCLRDGGLLFIAMAPLGALAATSYQQNHWTVLYFPLLFWVIYRGFKLFAHLRDDTGKALEVLANTIDKRDTYTYQHSLRVAAYVAQTAARLKLPADEVELIVSAAHVHDLGKIAIDNRILFKEGPLTAEERQQVNTHPAAGAELAGQFCMYGEGAEIIRHHHERWDGSGYPDGLVGEAIPLGARLIAVADVYDAMTSDRPYRRALSHEVAVSELTRGAGTQFDSRVVEAFLAPAEETRRRPEGCTTPVRSYP